MNRSVPEGKGNDTVKRIELDYRAFAELQRLGYHDQALDVADACIQRWGAGPDTPCTSGAGEALSRLAQSIRQAQSTADRQAACGRRNERDAPDGWRLPARRSVR